MPHDSPPPRTGHSGALGQANIFSKATFWFLNPLMARGYRKPLEFDELPPMEQRDLAESGQPMIDDATRLR